jgi:hypothetical protein
MATSEMLNPSRVTAVSLVGVILALLLVGGVSSTPVRHLIQVAPATLVLVLLLRQVRGAIYAALPVFVIWLLVMVAIWLYLLDVARIITGRFSSAEVALTLVIGASCLCGLSQFVRVQPITSRALGAAWAIVFAALQVGAIWVSLRAPFANN